MLYLEILGGKCWISNEVTMSQQKVMCPDEKIADKHHFLVLKKFWVQNCRIVQH